MTVVLSYNVIQGQINDQPWMMTFCNACNTGMVFDPVMNGQTLHFRRRGAYDGLLLIWDEETNSYWQHITGQCLYGSSQGQQLRQITTTRQINGAEAAAYSGTALLLTSPLTEEQQKLSHHCRENAHVILNGWKRALSAPLAQEDTRRPRFELGLGVWSSSGSTFFPLEMLYANDSIFMTEFEGRRMLIYQLPEAIAPVAAYVDAKRAYWERDVLRLDGGAYIQNDQYFTSDGQSKALERPMQLLMRWYGFALTFPGCVLAKRVVTTTNRIQRRCHHPDCHCN